MQHSPDQAAALAYIDAFLLGPQRKQCVVHGLAGTGKTALLCELARRRSDAILCAPTNKAAANLATKTGRQANTIHSLIYFPNEVVDQDGKLVQKWIEKDFYADLVLLDECSMVGQKIAPDLLGKCGQLIAFGDPGQLPPVEDTQYFTDPDVTLTTNHRQARSSGIINQALAVREGQPYQSDIPEFKVITPSEFDMCLRHANLALCHRNEDRRYLNKRKRKMLGFPEGFLQAGEALIGMRNDRKRQIFNAYLYKVAADRYPGQPILLEGFKVPIKAHIEDFDAQFDVEYDPKRKTLCKPTAALLAPAYVMTVHKAQGSEFDRVLVVSRYYGRDGEQNRWLYTAITRAKNLLMIH